MAKVIRKIGRMWNDPMGYLFFLESPYQKQSQKAMDYQSMEMIASFINL